MGGGRKTKNAEEGLDEGRKGVIGSYACMHEIECETEKMETGSKEREKGASGEVGGADK